MSFLHVLPPCLRLLRKLKIAGGDEKVAEIMTLADTDQNGNIDLDEWIAFVKTPEAQVTFERVLRADEEALLQRQKMIKAFNEVDTDRSGSIDRDELGKMLQKLGIEGGASKVDELIELADADRSGTIELDEWVAFLELSGRGHRV